MMPKRRIFAVATLPVALLAGCAMMTRSAVIPDNLKVPATQLLALETHATGVQIYECKSSKDSPTGFDWVFLAPEADLIDTAGIKVGKHYVGPTWEAIDGSKVVGEVKARNDGPDPKAIPWLLLSAKSTAGKGMLGQTTSIQRLQTGGGKAPGDSCTQAQLGTQARGPYEATYLFYVTKP